VLAVRAVEMRDEGRDWMLVDLGADVLSCESMVQSAECSIVTGESLTRSK